MTQEQHLVCPHCNKPLQPFELPDNTGWQTDFQLACFNDECPYFVRGSFQVEDRHGNTFDTGPRATLCRCGHSQNQPFCDLSHREAGFRSYPRAEERDD